MADQTRQLIDAFPMPSLFISNASVLTHANSAAKQLLPSLIEGRNYLTVLRQPEFQTAFNRALASAAPQSCELDLRVDQQDHRFRATIRPAGSDGFLVCLADQSELIAASAIRRDFVANVSHELRTPLTAILGFIETMRGPARNDAEATDRFLGIMKTEADRMSSLVADLLALSRVEENERRRPRDPVDLVGLAGSVATALKPIAEQASMQIDTLVPDQPVVVAGDPDELRRALINLTENALHYGAAGKRAEIEIATLPPSAASPAGCATVTVRDFGEGIAEHHITRLTERFYRVDTHRSRKAGGTGLGLSIVKHIVNRHRGRLAVTSTPGVKTEFRITLPLTSSPGP